MRPMQKPIIIAHRGASGYRPEHTLESYRLAVAQGADFIEPDLVSTGDGHLIARHDNVLNLTTDVAKREQFANRKTTRIIGGRPVEGWFSEDFTLEEIKTLRAVARIPQIRPANAEYDGRFEIPTLQEVITLTKTLEVEYEREIGLYIETKYPAYFAARDLTMGPVLLDVLAQAGYSGRDAPIFLQSFEVGNLKWLRQHTDLPLTQLLWLEGSPADVEQSGDSLTYEEMATVEGLRQVAEYADGVGPEKYHFILGADEEGRLDPGNASSFIDDAHAAGLVVHPYTFRAENAFLPPALRTSDRKELPGLLEDELLTFMRLGVDGVFTDNPDIGVAAKKKFLQG